MGHPLPKSRGPPRDLGGFVCKRPGSPSDAGRSVGAAWSFGRLGKGMRTSPARQRASDPNLGMARARCKPQQADRHPQDGQGKDAGARGREGRVDRSSARPPTMVGAVPQFLPQIPSQIRRCGRQHRLKNKSWGRRSRPQPRSVVKTRRDREPRPVPDDPAWVDGGDRPMSGEPGAVRPVRSSVLPDWAGPLVSKELATFTRLYVAGRWYTFRRTPRCGEWSTRSHRAVSIRLGRPAGSIGSLS